MNDRSWPGTACGGVFRIAASDESGDFRVAVMENSGPGTARNQVRKLVVTFRFQEQDYLFSCIALRVTEVNNFAQS